jgi:hypothetical protein
MTVVATIINYTDASYAMYSDSPTFESFKQESLKWYGGNKLTNPFNGAKFSGFLFKKDKKEYIINSLKIKNVTCIDNTNVLTPEKKKPAPKKKNLNDDDSQTVISSIAASRPSVTASRPSAAAFSGHSVNDILESVTDDDLGTPYQDDLELEEPEAPIPKPSRKPSAKRTRAIVEDDNKIIEEHINSRSPPEKTKLAKRNELKYDDLKIFPVLGTNATHGNIKLKQMYTATLKEKKLIIIGGVIKIDEDITDTIFFVLWSDSYLCVRFCSGGNYYVKNQKGDFFNKGLDLVEHEKYINFFRIKDIAKDETSQVEILKDIIFDIHCDIMLKGSFYRSDNYEYAKVNAFFIAKNFQIENKYQNLIKWISGNADINSLEFDFLSELYVGLTDEEIKKLNRERKKNQKKEKKNAEPASVPKSEPASVPKSEPASVPKSEPASVPKSEVINSNTFDWDSFLGK